MVFIFLAYFTLYNGLQFHPYVFFFNFTFQLFTVLQYFEGLVILRFEYVVLELPRGLLNKDCWAPTLISLDNSQHFIIAYNL